MSKTKKIIIPDQASQIYDLSGFTATDLIFEVKPLAQLKLSVKSGNFKVNNLFFILYKQSQVSLDWFNNLHHLALIKQYQVKASLIGAGANLDIKLRHLSQSYTQIDYLFNIDSTNKDGRVCIQSRRLLNNQATSLLKANIRVDSLAKNSQIYLSDNSLLLNNKCHSLIEPNLEILNSQTKAYHKTAVSCIRPEEIAYLNSRGISNKQANSWLVKAFMNQQFISHPSFD